METELQHVDMVDAARGGDEEAWEDLYRRLYPRLRAYLSRRLGPAAAEDAVSETMARAIAGVGLFRDGPAGLDGWIFGIARRVAADHYRRAGRHRRQLDAGHRLLPGPEGDGGSLDGLVRDDDHRAVRRHFERLPAPERELLELRVVAGLSADETASVLGKRPGAVRTAQSRALARLRRMLEDDVG